MKFAYPWMLALTALVPLAGIWWTFLRARASRRLAALNARCAAADPGFRRLQMPLILAGLALVTFAAARPQWGRSKQSVQSRSRNVVVALDVSRSMLAGDVRPNRLERAKADLADLVNALEGDRCAVVAFRHGGTLVCPLTTDRAYLRSAIESVSPLSAPRGETDLASAIRVSLEALDPAADDHNAIILVSDGGDLRGGAAAAAQLAKRRGIPVFTVGIGDPRKDSAVPGEDGAPVQLYKNSPVKTRLEEKALVEIARISGGRYVPLATAGMAETTFGAIYRRFLRQVAAKEQAEEEELRATERFGVFLVPGIFLMLLAAMMSRGRFSGRTARRRAFAAAAVFAAALRLSAAVAPSAAESAPSAAEPSASGEASDRDRPEETDGEVWNRGVDLYRAGDMTNALAVLRPLMLSKTHGARASEVVAKIAYDRKDLETAAFAAQIALRSNPDDPRLNRNFTRATDRLPEMREEAHVKEVLEKLGAQQPDALAGSAVRDVRAVMEEQKSVLTNRPHAAIAKSEALAKRTENLADVWIAIREAAAQAAAQNATNQQQLAYVHGAVDAAHESTKKAAVALADMDVSAAEHLSLAENAFTRFWKMAIMPPAAVDEAITAQTNAFAGIEMFNNRPWQREALDFTLAFRARFDEWAKAYEMQAQSDTNMPPFTAEAKAEIEKLAAETEEIEKNLCKSELPPEQLKALANLERIRELLPKNKNGGGGQNGQQQHNQNGEGDKNKDGQNQDDKQQNQDDKQQNQDDKRQDQEDQNKNSGEENKPEEKESQAEDKDAGEDEKTDAEVDAILDKAKERSDEHENEKRARMRSAPLPPNERDW